MRKKCLLLGAVLSLALTAYSIAGPDLTAPTQVRAIKVTDSLIKVTWAPVANASVYVVYRNGKSFALVNGTSFDDVKIEKDQGYSYRIQAVNGSGRSPFSAATHVAAHGQGKPPSAPGGMKIVQKKP